VKSQYLTWERILGRGFLGEDSWERILGRGFLGEDSWERIVRALKGKV
jgi:hypothetical protein